MGMLGEVPNPGRSGPQPGRAPTVPGLVWTAALSPELGPALTPCTHRKGHSDSEAEHQTERPAVVQREVSCHLGGGNQRARRDHQADRHVERAQALVGGRNLARVRSTSQHRVKLGWARVRAVIAMPGGCGHTSNGLAACSVLTTQEITTATGLAVGPPTVVDLEVTSRKPGDTGCRFTLGGPQSHGVGVFAEKRGGAEYFAKVIKQGPTLGTSSSWEDIGQHGYQAFVERDPGQDVQTFFLL